MIAKAITMDLRQIAMLLVFFISYVIIGGVVFMHIEAPHEVEEKEKMRESLLAFKDGIRSLDLSSSTQDNLSLIINTFLMSQSTPTLNEDREAKLSSHWDFFNSFFFAITVVTTIGYGHLSPSTHIGKMFCLIYALFGIPMTGILLGAIGDRFSRCFLAEIHRARRRNERKFSMRLVVLKRGLMFFVPWFIVFLVVPALVFHLLEDWTFIESFYYCFITLSTIGFGDLVAGQFDGTWVWLYKLILVLWIIFGLAYLSMILNFISQGLRSHSFTHVVHSIRRMSGPHALHGMRHKHHRNKAALQADGTIPFPFMGDGGCSTPCSISPTPSPSMLHGLAYNTSSSGSIVSRNRRFLLKKPMVLRRMVSAIKRRSIRKRLASDENVDKENDVNRTLNINNNDVKMGGYKSDVVVVITHDSPLMRRGSLPSSENTSFTNCESPSPQPLTRAELTLCRKAFFSTLDDAQDCIVTNV